MSEVVRYKGILKEVKKVNDCSLEELCELIFREENPNEQLPSYCDNYQEWLEDEYYYKYYIRDDKLYLVEKEQVNFVDCFFEGNKKDDGIEFHVMYYNGGCGFNEALDEVMDKITT